MSRRMAVLLGLTVCTGFVIGLTWPPPGWPHPTRHTPGRRP